MSGQKPQPKEYLSDVYLSSFTEKYNVYQKRYTEEPREGDKILIQLVRDAASKRLGAGDQVALLDVGCSTGNFLLHLKRAVPGLNLVGCDLAVSAIESCRRNPALAGIQFEVMGIFDLPRDRFDIIVTNAATYFFDYAQYEQAIASIGLALKRGGRWFSFEFVHPYEQDIHIVEKSRSHPRGLNLYFRPFSVVKQILEKRGFTGVHFLPFAIPIDLAKGVVFTDNCDGEEELNTYTVKTESGQRMLFRGTLFQPWCHLTAVKAG
ncbi:MAG: class I SAM-dependent methyltransferase [Nitrospira sp.]|nr:class I SAM-dependent methyltransferase [Nitrospira sp.]